MKESIKNENEVMIVETIENVVENSIEGKPYIFRKFKASDMTLMFKVLSKLGFKDFKNAINTEKISEAIANGKKGGKTAENLFESVGIEVGLGIVDILLNNVDKCQEDLYKLLSAVSNLSVQEIKDLSLADFANMIIDFTQKDDFKDFMKVVSRLFK